MNSTSVDKHKFFPSNVFLDKWSHYLFFDPDWVFSPDFIRFCLDVTKHESNCIIEITDLDEIDSTLLINAETTWELFHKHIVGNNFNGWLYDAHRFFISSTSQCWCIYLERSVEIAIFAHKEGCNDSIISFAEETFKAKPIATMAIEKDITAFAIRNEGDPFIIELINSYSI